jgi:agmatine deiminase
MSSPNIQTPAELGYHMPAEWRRHAATWLTWPKDPLTWPDRVPQVEEIYLQMMAALTPNETVHLLVDNEATEAAVRARCTFEGRENIRFHQLETVDSWIRDYGPNFLVNHHDELAYNHWIFNAWGNKYEELKRDSSIPARLEPLLGVPRFEPLMVLEGGAIDVNGAGCLLTTEQCLLNTNRNPKLSREEIEQRLKNYLGVQKILWLKEGIAGDDTDGHIDDIARFVSARKIVCVSEDDPADENYELLRENLRLLQGMTDIHGEAFEIVTLPMPGLVAGSEGIGERNLERLPASYANFYIANGVVLVPIFGKENDKSAVKIIQGLFPDRRVVAINCEPLVWGMGTIHCVTQQQPDSSKNFPAEVRGRH